MDLSVASSLHGNKITADKDLREITKSLKSAISGTSLRKLAQDNIHILKMQGRHLWKEDNMLNNSSQRGTGISCTD